MKRTSAPPILKALAAALAVAALFGLPGRPLPAVAQGFRPPATCEEVAAATTRGGALPEAPRPGGGACNGPPAQRGDLVLVERVIDGDTIVIAGGERVRYVGIDAPELRPRPEPFAREALEANRRLAQGRYVRLVPGVTERDRFGRLLRYVIADGVLVEAELVREGLARAQAYQPGQPYAPCLERLEREARTARRGMWGATWKRPSAPSAHGWTSDTWRPHPWAGPSRCGPPFCASKGGATSSGSRPGLARSRSARASTSGPW